MKEQKKLAEGEYQDGDLSWTDGLGIKRLKSIGLANVIRDAVKAEIEYAIAMTEMDEEGCLNSNHTMRKEADTSWEVVMEHLCRN